MELIFVFICGLVAGSFLLVLIDRLPAGKPVLVDRSVCDFCKHILSWYDLIPVFSYLSIGAKCRYCMKKLPIKYPLMELLNGCLFVSLYLLVFKVGFNYPLLFGSSLFQFIFLLVILSTLLVIFFTDLKDGIIPFGVVLVGVISALIYLGLADITLLLSHLVTAVLTMLFFLSIFLLTKKRGIGFGDVVYGFYMGLLLGYPRIIVGLYLSFLTGAFVSIILVLLKKKKLRGDSVPFGPFLILGTILSFLFGDISWAFIGSYIGL